MDEFSWLDVDIQAPAAPVAPDIVQQGAHMGADKVWTCNGEYIWFRRGLSNPATLERHERFVANGDYVYLQTQDDVEVWQLRPQSQFFRPKGEVNLSQLNTYNVRRQATLAACRRDWKAFVEVMGYLRERFTGQFHAAQAEMVYAETYGNVMAAIAMRNGPSPGEVNREVLSLMQSRRTQQDRIISIGR